MREAKVIKDAPVQQFNTFHKTFSATNEIVPEGSEITGEVKFVEGLHRGKPITYRLFITTDNKIIHLNKTNIPMEVTEVTLGADGTQIPPNPAKNNNSSVKTAETINLPGINAVGKNALIMSLVAGGSAFAFAKYYKKYDMKKSLYFAIGGILVGGIAGYMYDKKPITIKKN